MDALFSGPPWPLGMGAVSLPPPHLLGTPRAGRKKDLSGLNVCSASLLQTGAPDAELLCSSRPLFHGLYLPPTVVLTAHSTATYTPRTRGSGLPQGRAFPLFISLSKQKNQGH